MTDVTPADISNLSPEQLAALATAIQQEQTAQQDPNHAGVTGSPDQSIPQPAVESANISGTALAPTSQEAPIQPAQHAIINGMSGVIQNMEDLAVAAEPAVSLIAPPIGAALAVGVAVLNSLSAMEGWLGLVPPGQAVLGIQQEMTKIKQLINPTN